MAGLQSLVGGEIHEYTSLLEDTRKEVIDRLVKNAQSMGANAIVMMRFDSSAAGSIYWQVFSSISAILGLLHPSKNFFILVLKTGI